MQAFLRLMGGLCPDRGQLTVGYQSSALNRRLPIRYPLSPNTYKLIPLLLFILVFVSCDAAQAQEHGVHTAPAAKAENKAIDLTSLGIQIGEKVPDVTITNIHNYKSSTAKVSDFKGKLLILDFWATWCGACVAMFPKMDSLQREFSDKVQFLSVTYQKEDEVLRFRESIEKRDNKRYELPFVVENNQLKELFPYGTLPHYVWIDGEGTVVAITESEEISAENILAATAYGNPSFPQKRDMFREYDQTKPLFYKGNLEEDSLKFFSVLTGYQEGVGTGWYNNEVVPDDKISHLRFTGRNMTLAHLYQIAYHKNRSIDWKHTLIQVKYPENLTSGDKKGEEYLSWLQDGHGFCYEIIIPSKEGPAFYDFIKKDLDMLFPEYRASVQKIEKECLVLKSIDHDLLVSKGGEQIAENDFNSFKIQNCPIGVLIDRLDWIHKQKIFFIDETDIKEYVDLEFEADLRDIGDVNKALAKYGLSFVKENRNIEMLVISDR